MPRPKRSDNKETRIQIRASHLEKSVLSREAKKAGMTLTEYLLRRGLGIRVISRVDDHLINELRRLGGLMKLLASQLPADADRFEEVRRELISAIKRI